MGKSGSGADAAQNAARDKANAAEAQMNLAKSFKQETIQSLMGYDQTIKMQEKNIGRQEQMLAQIDPTIIEASQQALKLMRGEQASTLGPLQKQRDMQRQKLLNSLREKLGPGAETSSAGMQALTRFDSETDQLFAGAQQQAIQSLGNTFGQFNQGRPDMLREIGGLGQMQMGRTQAIQGANQGILGMGQGIVDNAGWQHTAAVIKSQQRRALGGQLIQAGATIGGAMLGGPAGAAAGNKLGGAFAQETAGGSYKDYGNMA